MLNWLTGRAVSGNKASQLYGAVVAGARQPYFFQAAGVPDTPEGRLEMLILHLFLVLERLRGGGLDAENISRLLLETFVSDLDGSLREMGVGDLSVPKKVKSAAAIFYARADAYRAALAADGTDVLEKLIAANVTTMASGEFNAAARVADYMRRSVPHLVPIDLVAGAASGLFPPPAA